MPERELRELVERAQAGDRAAFEQLYHQHSAMVYNLCFRMVGNRQEAEDITQDVFLQAFRAIKRFRTESKVSSWLYRIAVNRCLNHERREKLARWVSLDGVLRHPEDGSAALTSPSHARPDRILERAETERMVNEAINSLPKRQRVAVLLRRYEGLSYQEVAGVMRCSVSSVQSLLHRAKVTLAQDLLRITHDV